MTDAHKLAEEIRRNGLREDFSIEDTRTVVEALRSYDSFTEQLARLTKDRDEWKQVALNKPDAEAPEKCARALMDGFAKGLSGDDLLNRARQPLRRPAAQGWPGWALEGSGHLNKAMLAELVYVMMDAARKGRT